MSKLRRIAEVGDGSYEQLVEKNTRVVDPLQSAKERKNKFASIQEIKIPEIDNWEEIKGSIKMDRKPFDINSFSSYDVSNISVKRVENGIEEEEDSYDPRIASSLHLYGDPMEQLGEMLKESMEEEMKRYEQKEMRNMQKIKKAQDWDEEATAWANKRMSSSRKGIMKTADEETIDSKFGQPDYDLVNKREAQKNQMIENMQQRHRSIKDSRLNITKEERRSQWENNDNIRSASIQQKMSNSKLFNKLSQIVQED